MIHILQSFEPPSGAPVLGAGESAFVLDTLFDCYIFAVFGGGLPMGSQHRINWLSDYLDCPAGFMSEEFGA